MPVPADDLAADHSTNLELSLTVDWGTPDSDLAEYIGDADRRCLEAYRANPLLVVEHANIERATAQGGYGRRQIYELVQNAADALLRKAGGKVEIILTSNMLYAANEGDAITQEGIDALLSSHISRKRGGEIGRFGLGFKSVLGVTDAPEMYSRSVSLGFNPRTAARIRSVVRDVPHIPLLRLAEVLDPFQAATADPTLQELMSWATTVIRLHLNPLQGQWLTDSMHTFPAEFLLFCPHIGRLRLEDRVQEYIRDIHIIREESQIRLEELEQKSVWKVFSSVHTPSAVARKDAGELADREELPVVWAVPLQGRTVRGRFWAFAPTEFDTTLSGIINAPWKTNEDRQTLLQGPFNQELIRVVAQLVAVHLEELTVAGEPAGYLDILPGRGREAAQWADQLLTDLVNEAASHVPSIPDQAGVLRFPSSMYLHPAGIPAEALQIWAAYPGRPVNWCHPSVDNRDRRARVERLMKPHGRIASSVETWLEALVVDATPAASIAALQVGTKTATYDLNKRVSVQHARIVLTQQGTFVAAQPGTVFLPRAEGTLTQGVPIVHSAVASDPEGRRAVQDLGIKEVDAGSELQALLLASPFTVMRTREWERFWGLVRQVEQQKALELIRQHLTPGEAVVVRTVSGDWRPLSQVLLPGPIVPGDGSRDRKVTIDTALHSIEILRQLGGRDEPTSDGGSIQENWYTEYRQQAVAMYMKRVAATASAPRERDLEFNLKKTAGPLDVFMELSDEGRALYTARLAQIGAAELMWRMEPRSPQPTSVQISIESPWMWRLRQHGRLKTLLGVRPVGSCVGPTLREWQLFFPAVYLPEDAARRLKLPMSLEELKPSHWHSGLTVAEGINDDELLGRFYAAACRAVEPPKQIRCRRGSNRELRPPTEVTVVVETEEASVLARIGEPFCRVASNDDAAALSERWGLRPTAQAVSKNTITTVSGSEIPLSDRFPGLAVRLSSEQSDLRLVPCSAVRVEYLTNAGKWGPERTMLQIGSAIYFADRLGDAELLDAVAETLRVPMSSDDRKRILDLRKLEGNRKRQQALVDEPTLGGKLLLAVGIDAIRRRLPRGLAAGTASAGQDGDLTAAKMAMAVYGVETLSTFRQDLAVAGFAPPAQWAGSHAARRFVKSLGFPPEYAGFETKYLDPVLEVEGPPDLPQLHAFQAAIVSRIRSLPQHENGRRGILSLPTGAGKTRLMVEALTLAVKDDQLKGPILWIAQSEELCEQAVQTWSYVWRALGPLSRLHLNRLWGPREADTWEAGTQVVVATVQKLQNCTTDIGYKWLAGATWVVIDEAHASIGPSYTKVMDWLGLGRNADRVPLVGLTATPFRGGEEETVQLVRRYNQHRLDEGVLGDNPYDTLQEMGVLAYVDHQVLKGATVDLTAGELEELERLRRVPASVDARVGQNVERNEVLLESIRELDPAWPVLLFATSVEHAQTMAALLNLSGVTAAAVSAETDIGARRYYIDAFRQGRLRVLTNYSVLTAGFDAPAVRAVYVARPTYSPGLYQQMIGRGLRGPKNGGKERCLIVNVEDNLVQFGGRLAFRDFEYLWNKE